MTQTEIVANIRREAINARIACLNYLPTKPSNKFNAGLTLGQSDTWIAAYALVANIDEDDATEEIHNAANAACHG